MPDGVKACQLKAVDSGEIITVVQTGPDPKGPPTVPNR